MEDDEFLTLKLMKEENCIETFTDRSEIVIDTDDKCLFYLYKLRELKNLRKKQIDVIDRAINVVKKDVESIIDRTEFDLCDVLDFIKLMRYYPDNIEEIQACSDYLANCIEHDVKHTSKTFDAGLEAMSKIMEILTKKKK